KREAVKIAAELCPSISFADEESTGEKLSIFKDNQVASVIFTEFSFLRDRGILSPPVLDYVQRRLVTQPTKNRKATIRAWALRWLPVRIRAVLKRSISDEIGGNTLALRLYLI